MAVPDALEDEPNIHVSVVVLEREFESGKHVDPPSVVRDDEGWVATIASDRLARFVHIDLPGFEAADNWFHLAPGVERRVALKQVGDAADPRGVIRAVNGLDIARIGGAA